MKKNKSEITVIGAGKLANSLIPALLDAGYGINCIISKRYNDAESLALKYGIEKYGDSLNSDPSASKVFLLAVPDDQLKSVASGITRTLKAIKGKYFIHFSGVMESAVLKPIAEKGGVVASFHIIQTFTSGRITKLNNAFASIETQDKNLEKYLSLMAEALKLNSFNVKPGKKTSYHLAAVFASNFLVSNIFISERLFREAGISEDFYRAIEPIIKSTLRNIKTKGAAESLSGPVDRGDIVTVKKHITSLKREKRLLSNYIIQSINLLDIKKEKGIYSPAHKKIENYLSAELKKKFNQEV